MACSRSLLRPAALLLLAGLVCLAGCDIFELDELDRDHTITIQNRSECDLRIHMDGTFLFALEADGDGSVTLVEEGTRVLVAYLDLGGVDGDAVAGITLHLGGYEDYSWKITACGEDAS